MTSIERNMPGEGGSSPDIGSTSEQIGKPDVVVVPEKNASDQRGGFLNMFRRSKPIVLVKPGESKASEAPKAPLPTSEISVENPTQVSEGPTREHIIANASLSDQERLQRTRELLKITTQLTPKQEEAVIIAHKVGSAEPGKDKAEAGVYNYTRAQLLHKARILKEAGFNKEQADTLLRSGLTGILPPLELADLDPAVYSAEPVLQTFAEQLRSSANEWMADEALFNRYLDRLDRLEDQGGLTNTALIQQLRQRLQRGQFDAQAKGLARRPEQRQGPTSEFDNALNRQERDRILKEVNEPNLDLLRDAKTDLFEIYYEARVEVTSKQKLTGDETGRPAKLRELATLRQRMRVSSWEQEKNFWEGKPQALQDKYGGVVDYFYRNNLEVIEEVVKNRHAILSPEHEALGQYWNYQWTGENEVSREAKDFDEIREQIETERKKRYFVPNRGDYESYIQLVADDIEEFDESIPYVLDYIRTKFQSNDPDKVYGTVEQEEDKVIKALDKFAFDRGYEIGSPEYRKVRRTKSRLGNSIKLLGVEEMAKLVHEQWNGYYKFMGPITRGFKDTETQDHFVDAVLLDNEGMMMLALDQFEVNDGEYWRYGRNTAETQNNLQIGDGQKWQALRKEEILNSLVDYELKPMRDLLNLGFITSTVNGVTTRRRIPRGNPTHPAFQRLKNQLDTLDEDDLRAGRPSVDADGNPKERWQEYVEKAVDWELNYTIGDPRDKKQRVLFQHPLARNLNDQEFNQMYRPAQRTTGETDSQFNRRLREKRQRMRNIIDTALRVSTAFQQDAHAGLARHILTLAQKQELGLPVDDEAIPHSRLIGIMLERAMREDAAKPVIDQRFKLTHVLERMGLTRDLPLFSNWYLGAHDTIRPGLLSNGIPDNKIQANIDLRGLLKEKEQVRALDPDDYFGGDFKTSLSRMPEEERQFWEIMELYVREEFPSYFNFPGHDTEGGGVKEMRNVLLFPYGQSWGTVELSSLVKNMWLGEQAFLPAFGCKTWKQFVALQKGGNEIVFQRMGGLFESPRDAENWLKRIEAIVNESKYLTSGGEKGGNGMLNDGWGNGFHRWRELNRSAGWMNEVKGKFIATDIVANLYTTILEPDVAYDNLDQKTYEAYINLAGQFVVPLISLFEARMKLETNYARNPGTAMFLNTLTWYSVSNWMDRNWEEYRGKYGNALDVNLHMARKFIRTALYESRLMYYDDQWDQRMLGYTIPQDEWSYIQSTNWGSMTEEQRKKDRPITKIISYQTDSQGRTIAQEDIKDRNGKVIVKKGNSVEGRRVEGILDAFPKEWRDKIIARNNQTEEPWIIPMGLNTEYPEVNGVIKQLEKFGERPGMRIIYESLLKPDQMKKQTRPRKTVKRA